MGKDLIKFGLIPSKEFSKILSEAYEAQIEGKFKDHSGAILWLKSHL
jgi:tRNA nucleotidyltransferase (CCA-adding enzyme)